MFRVKEKEVHTLGHRSVMVIIGLVLSKIISFQNCYWFPGNCNILSLAFQLFMKSLHSSWVRKVGFYLLTLLFSNFLANLYLACHAQLAWLKWFVDLWRKILNIVYCYSTMIRFYCFLLWQHWYLNTMCLFLYLYNIFSFVSSKYMKI